MSINILINGFPDKSLKPTGDADGYIKGIMKQLMDERNDHDSPLIFKLTALRFSIGFHNGQRSILYRNENECVMFYAPVNKKFKKLKEGDVEFVIAWSKNAKKVH